MSCPCRLCNSREFFQDIHPQSYQPEEVEVEEPKSIYDRLAKVADELNKYGAPAHFINDLNQLCEDIDEVDSELQELMTRGNEFQLNEISKKLF